MMCPTISLPSHQAAGGSASKSRLPLSWYVVIFCPCLGALSETLGGTVGVCSTTLAGRAVPYEGDMGPLWATLGNRAHAPLLLPLTASSCKYTILDKQSVGCTLKTNKSGVHLVQSRCCGIQNTKQQPPLNQLHNHIKYGHKLGALRESR